MIESFHNSDLAAVFVNSDKPPDLVIKYPFFDYIKSSDNEIVFLQLHKKVYIVEDSIRYSVLSWERIAVPKNITKLYTQLVDSHKELQEVI